MCPFWNVPFWNVLTTECLTKWNATFSECALFEMCPFWNVPKTECLRKHMLLFKMTVFKRAKIKRPLVTSVNYTKPVCIILCRKRTV